MNYKIASSDVLSSGAYKSGHNTTMQGPFVLGLITSKFHLFHHCLKDLEPCFGLLVNDVKHFRISLMSLEYLFAISSAIQNTYNAQRGALVPKSSVENCKA